MEWKAINLGYVFVVISSEFKDRFVKNANKRLKFPEVRSQLRLNNDMRSDSLCEDTQVPVKCWSIFVVSETGGRSFHVIANVGASVQRRIFDRTLSRTGHPLQCESDLTFTVVYSGV